MPIAPAALLPGPPFMGTTRSAPETASGLEEVFAALFTATTVGQPATEADVAEVSAAPENDPDPMADSTLVQAVSADWVLPAMSSVPAPIEMPAQEVLMAASPARAALVAEPPQIRPDRTGPEATPPTPAFDTPPEELPATNPAPMVEPAQAAPPSMSPPLRPSPQMRPEAPPQAPSAALPAVQMRTDDTQTDGEQDQGGGDDKRRIKPLTLSADRAAPVVAALPAAQTDTRPQAIAAADVPPQPQRSAPVHHQIAAAIQASPDGRVELRLSPEELGRVTMEIRHEGGQMQVSVIAERVDTQDLLRRNIGLLGQDLRDLGFGDVRFSFGGDPRGSGSTPDRGLPDQPQAAVSADAALPEITPPPISQRMVRGGLDLRL